MKFRSMPSILHMYLVSDSSGETVNAVAKAASIQFEHLETIEYAWPLIRSKAHMDELIESIKLNPGIVIYTIIDKDLRGYLKKSCSKLKIPCVSPIAKIIEEMSSYLKINATRSTPGKNPNLDEEYFRKIDAIGYTIHHDDGQLIENYNSADILLLGISRTSKTPTALYLAQRGYKTANIPIIQNRSLDLRKITKPFIVGLTLTPERLARIRKIRASNISHRFEIEQYTDIEHIKEEVSYALNLFYKYQIPIIDVTRKAIEETATEIINMYLNKKGEHNINHIF